MKKTVKISIAIALSACVITLFQGCGTKTESLSSPNGKYEVSVSAENEAQALSYQVSFNGEQVISPSKMGFLLEGNEVLGENLVLSKVVNNSIQQSWKPLYGERSEYPENYNESILTYASAENNTDQLRVRFRAYNEGVAFRYEFIGDRELQIKEEITEFSVQPDALAWASETSQGVISKMPVSNITDRVERPLLIEYSESLYLAIGEAAQIDFSRMKIISTSEAGKLHVSLGGTVVDQSPFNSPWRFIMAGKSAGEILENNYLVLNLNEPGVIEDHAWIKPGKVMRDMTLTTKGGKVYIDFAVEYGVQYIIESAGWYGNEYSVESDASTVTVDPSRGQGPLDMAEVIRYGEEKGIDIMVYVNRNQMEKQLDQILPIYKEWGIKGIKYGYVRTGDQEWTSWMHEAVRKAADHKMVLSIHDDYRPVGYSRTYPNLMTQEGIRGDEETPSNEHTLMTMFTRMIAGAADNTICYFAPRVDIMGSHASQLAKGVCIYSPLLWLYWYDRPLAAVTGDISEAGFNSIILPVPEMEFFKVLPTVWDDTKVIHSEVGVLGTIARKNGEDWFVGTINGNKDRTVSFSLDFLDMGRDYEAVIYFDDENVDTPTRVGIDTITVDSEATISRDIMKNNGMAIRIYPK